MGLVVIQPLKLVLPAVIPHLVRYRLPLVAVVVEVLDKVILKKLKKI